MQPTHNSYDALMTTHRARIESARASAVAAGLGRQPRRGARTIEALRRFKARGHTVRPEHSPETLFFA